MLEVYKHDGTTQSGKGVETTLDVMQMDLERLGGKVLKGEKRMWPTSIPRQSELPTGWCNVYQLDEGWPQQLKEILSAGFGLWAEGAVTMEGPGQDAEPVAMPLETPFPWPLSVWGRTPGEAVAMPWPLATTGLAHFAPAGLGSLLGKQLRVYCDGDDVAQDFSVDRVNVVLNRETAAIIDIWFG